MACSTMPLCATGWPKELFKQPAQLDSILFCTRLYCGNVLKDPVQLMCGHRLCKDCLEHLLLIPETTRICNPCVKAYQDDIKQQLRPVLQFVDVNALLESDDQPWHEKLPQAVIRSGCADMAAAQQVHKMEAVCLFDCDTTMVDGKPLKIENIEKHMEECPHRPVICEACQKEVQFLHLDAHVNNDCAFRLLVCPNGCGMEGILYKDLAIHQRTVCSRKHPQCDVCGAGYTGTLENHHQTQCRPQTDHSACDVKMRRIEKELNQHKRLSEILMQRFTPECCSRVEVPQRLFEIMNGDIVKDSVGTVGYPNPQVTPDVCCWVMWKVVAVHDQVDKGWRFSEPFTLRPGWHMSLGVNLPGADDSNIQICLVRVKGEVEDEIVGSSMNLKVTVRMKDLQGTDDITKVFSVPPLPSPTDNALPAFGDIHFAPRSAIELESDYLLEEMMVLEVVVREENRMAFASS